MGLPVCYLLFDVLAKYPGRVGLSLHAATKGAAQLASATSREFCRLVRFVATYWYRYWYPVPVPVAISK